MADDRNVVAVRRDEGAARWWFGSLAEIKLRARDTGGLLTIIEITEPPDGRRVRRHPGCKEVNARVVREEEPASSTNPRWTHNFWVLIRSQISVLVGVR
jgi:hypothetical protein